MYQSDRYMEHAVNNATNVLDMSHLLGHEKKIDVFVNGYIMSG